MSPAAPGAVVRRHVVAGAPSHGVVIHAERLAAALPALAAVTERVGADGAADAARLGLDLLVADAVLLPLTDHLLGTSADAVEAVERLARRSRVAVVLHDVPQPEEGQARWRRRRDAYARIACAATAVVVSSDHEAALLRACLDDPASAAPVTVLPLPVEAGPSTGAARPEMARAEGGRVELGVLGWIHPGKGLGEVVDAAGDLRDRGVDAAVVNVGDVVADHVDHLRELERRAAARGVPFRVTGYLPDDAMARALAAVDVPVAAHRHISASGSVNSWLSAGRRPVVVDGTYVREVARRMPGSVTVTDDLAAAAAAALDDPSLTWLAPDVVLGPSWRESAQAHLDLLESL
ncbi:hypothetical protein [Terracoccus luteus]|uniref:Glycosyltransferase involved in cell wall biosynthesis n=1 Tax=Terracoccus luteus TaxID=53356 RepID=A0A839PUR6_9MICO|nr:hypothetical protein [Terracoccus luteus]MBB2986959.1 glycosyltransferase involved in cell wall biosynthesis [Terracoccus luteus]MCP2172610.1 glycosyltransferase involved in cell wall biosynthesis [Terracoccus luteus]